MSFNGEFFTSLPHPWHGLKPRADESKAEIVNAYIEMTPNDVVKYEIDKETGYLMVDRPQRTTSRPPAIYGFIPQTYCGERVAKLCTQVDEADGDPLDICIFSEREIDRAPLLLNAKIIGGIQMIDDGEADDKIIAVLDGDHVWGDIDDIADMSPIAIERLQHYFNTYKIAPGKNLHINVDTVYGRDQALTVVQAAIDDYWADFGQYHEKN